MDCYQTRLERLERANIRYRLGMLLLLTLGAALFVSGSLHRPAAPEEVVARSIRIVNAKGETVMSLSPDWNEQGALTISNSGRRGGLLQTNADDVKRTCSANKHTLANAVHANRVRKRISVAEAVALGLPKAYDPLDLQVVPFCALGGRYSIESAGDKFGIRCSLKEHGLFVPGE